MILWSNSIEDAMFFSLHPSSQCIIWISLLLMIFYFGHLIKVLSPSLSHYKETLQLISIWHYATILSLIKVLNLFTNNTFISWTHVFLCNWIGYNIFYCYFFLMLRLFLFKLLFPVLWICSQSSLSTSLLSGTKYPQIILYFPCSRLEIKHFFKEPWFVLIRKSI